MDVAPVKKLARPVTLAEIKADPAFKDFALVRISRLSVMPVSAAEWRRIEKLVYFDSLKPAGTATSAAATSVVTFSTSCVLVKNRRACLRLAFRLLLHRLLREPAERAGDAAGRAGGLVVVLALVCFASSAT